MLDKDNNLQNIEDINEYLTYKKLERKINRKEKDYQKKYDNIRYKGYTKAESDFINEIKKQKKLQKLKKNLEELNHTYIYSTTTIEEEQNNDLNEKQINECISF